MAVQSNWTPRKRAAAVFFAGFLAIQILVPLYMLTRPRPARFGWQMYSGAKAPLSITLIRKNGTEVTIPSDDYFGAYRGDLDVIETLPAYLCQRDSGVVSVRLNFAHSESLEFPCRK
jgi:hypothetical protein